jgi:LacI family transcriptional regulator
VPLDVSVTGYNDIPFLDLMQPALTAVRVPYRQMGTQGAAALIALMSGGSEQPATIKLTPTLVERASTAPPRDVG